MSENPQDLQLVLDKMFASEQKFDAETVRRWQARYPHYSREIAEAAADWREFEFFVLEDEETEDLSPVSDTAKNAMEKALSQFRRGSAEAIADLRETTKKKGVGRENLLKTLGVSETLMRKLERRNLSEIPRFIERKLAEALRVSTESLQAFFVLPPVLPQKARYKAKTAPTAQPKQSFAEAVRHDPELSAEEKRQLLALIEDEK